ncbi:hypothetical protein GmHk_01G001313 [Glycine max]|nr:hypothetical protein GmHk_01G001313 [Glycine max]
MLKSKRDVYLEVYLNGAHWQMVVILPKENDLTIFHKVNPRLLLGGLLLNVINKKEALSVGITSCTGCHHVNYNLRKFQEYWKTIIYFNDARPLEPERLKAFRIQWAKYYLKVKNET